MVAPPDVLSHLENAKRSLEKAISALGPEHLSSGQQHPSNYIQEDSLKTSAEIKQITIRLKKTLATLEGSQSDVDTSSEQESNDHALNNSALDHPLKPSSDLSLLGGAAYAGSTPGKESAAPWDRSRRPLAVNHDDSVPDLVDFGPDFTLSPNGKYVNRKEAPQEKGVGLGGLLDDIFPEESIGGGYYSNDSFFKDGAASQGGRGFHGNNSMQQVNISTPASPSQLLDQTGDSMPSLETQTPISSPYAGSPERQPLGDPDHTSTPDGRITGAENPPPSVKPTITRPARAALGNINSSTR